MISLTRAWHRKAAWLLLLWPLALIFGWLSAMRRRLLRPAARPESRFVPIVVVGNLTVGGTGKTPVVMALVSHLRQQGWQPGVISRGYGAQAESYPLVVDAQTPPQLAGDEPALIARQCQCPVVIDPDRVAALNTLIERFPVDVVLSDDGLQHYRLPRDIEIAVVDGSRLFGNGLLLPAGPLREPVTRLSEVDFLLLNGQPRQLPRRLASLLDRAQVMTIRPLALVNLRSGERRRFADAFEQAAVVQGVAGIGNPDRFFAVLAQLPNPLRRFPFPDHHPYHPGDFARVGVDPDQPVVMTAKDGIKCQSFASPNWWVLDFSVDLPVGLLNHLDQKLRLIS